MSFKRKAMSAFLDWKANKASKALLVTGARQVGKTFLVREFGRQAYQSFVEINLVENPAAREAIATAPNAESLFMRLSAFAATELVPESTLIFIDEVQECPQVVTALKFLVDRYGADYDFVISGSLLGVEFRQVRSFPVGYVSTVEMFPLDLEEYAWARGVPSLVIDEARAACGERRLVDEAVDTRLAQVFHEYLVVGGMPDAVAAFTASNNIQAVQRAQGDIVDMYRYDISKYAGDRARIVRKIFDLIPAELNTQGKRFIVSHVKDRSRFNRYENDFMWLVDAGVALPTYNTDEPRYPLELSADSSFFKMFMCDVGLLSHLCGMEVVRDLVCDRADINYGSIYENFVAQEFMAHGLGSPSPERHLYFFRSRKLGELDFVAELPRGRVTPIEVKSGKSYTRHSALSAALEVENYGIREAIVLREGNVEVRGKVVYLPMYMTMFLEREN